MVRDIHLDIIPDIETQWICLMVIKWSILTEEIDFIIEEDQDLQKDREFILINLSLIK